MREGVLARTDLRQDGEKLELREARHELGLQAHGELQRGRPLLHDHRNEHRHAAVGVAQGEKRLERLLRAERYLARRVAPGSEQPQQHVLREGAESRRLRSEQVAHACHRDLAQLVVGELRAAPRHQRV